MTSFSLNQRVRVQRDEEAYPSRGTWPRYRGQVGTVSRLNPEDDEYGIMFTPEGSSRTGGIVYWFKAWELAAITEQTFQGEVGHKLRTAPTRLHVPRKRPARGESAPEPHRGAEGS